MQLPTPQQYRARFEDKVVHNDKFTQFKFELIEPHEMPFVAGQYVSIKVSERGDRRSYSISSSPNIQHGFETLVDLTPGGLGSNLLKNLQFGDEIELLGPLGQFVIDQQNQEAELAFIATGSGISPFKAMILDQLQEKQDTRPITLYWGLRYAHELFWQDEFIELVETYENFHFTPILSRPSEEWPLSRGRVTDILETKEFAANTGFYLCGNDNMIADASNLLQAKAVDLSRIHYEKFF